MIHCAHLVPREESVGRLIHLLYHGKQHLRSNVWSLLGKVVHHIHGHLAAHAVTQKCQFALPGNVLFHKGHLVARLAVDAEQVLVACREG